MKGKRFTEVQIIRILQEAEAGLAVADVCRKHNPLDHPLFIRTTFIISKFMPATVSCFE